MCFFAKRTQFCDPGSSSQNGRSLDSDRSRENKIEWLMYLIMRQLERLERRRQGEEVLPPAAMVTPAKG
jgi:hypothetical protein